MDIAAMSMNLQMAPLQQSVSVSIMKLALHAAGESSNGLLRALGDTASVKESPILGNKIDVTV